MSDQILHIGFIVHGKPARVRRFQKILQRNQEELRDTSYEVVYTKPGTAGIIARNMAEQGLTHIIAVGGDGTLGEVTDGIMKTGNREVIMGHLPAGTANDWMKTWRPANSFSELMDKIRSGAFNHADTGCITFSDQSKRFFLNIADVGIGAEVVRRVNNSPGWLGPNLLFFQGILRTFLSYRNREIQCISDGWKWSGKAKSMVLANGRFFGSGIAIAPEALPGDGLLELVILGDVSLFDYLRYLPDLKNGRKIQDPRVIYRQVRKITIQSSGDDDVEADGELIGAGSFTAEVVPAALRMLPPSE